MKRLLDAVHTGIRVVGQALDDLARGLVPAPQTEPVPVRINDDRLR
ncbi:MAG TPA: hypothetical protein VFB58_16935 [Chloroflexota bacterium]|nr:hypothetical protein [Chloroflexota bacterium]